MAQPSTSLSPPTFNGEQYHIWAIKMKTFLRGQGLWQYVEEDRQPPVLGSNPTLNQIRLHDEEATKSPRALSHIHAVVTEQVFTRIMAYESAKEAWDKLKEEFGGSDTTKGMQVLNLRREIEMLKMQESETVKEYVDRLMNVVNKIRLMGEEMTDKRIVEKVLVSLPERFESKISSLEDSEDLTQITLTDLVYALQAQEQKRLLRQEHSSEGAMVAEFKGKLGQGGSKRPAGEKKGKERMGNQWNKPTRGKEFPPCAHCKEKGHSEKSGCTNHMIANLEDFVNLDKSYHSKVKVGNGEFVAVKGRGDIAVQTKSVIKLIPNVLYVPSLSHNLLSVRQMMERKYALHFQDQFCTILDSERNELMKVRMMGKSFPIRLNKP
ncbi:uncharacterized protein LOC116117370 [Pistacia vera]|uniref:uncharacterized protein LOC116117370 n=1 Tax=Pistacia vera TaxID=55513 RepID=UPI00126330B0|nr:uncharacterized protein LOC116117370 [Pistacia vera]